MDGHQEKLQALAKYLNETYFDILKAKGRGFTIAKFAEWMGLKQPTLSRYMAGDMPPNGDNILTMARVMPKVLDILEYPDDPLLRRLLKYYFETSMIDQVEVQTKIDKLLK